MKYFITICLYTSKQLRLNYYTDEISNNYIKGVSYYNRQNRYINIDTTPYNPEQLNPLYYQTYFLIGDEGCTGLRNTMYDSVHNVPRHKAPRIIKELFVDACKPDVIRDIAQCALGKDTLYTNFYRGILNALEDALTSRR